MGSHLSEDLQKGSRPLQRGLEIGLVHALQAHALDAGAGLQRLQHGLQIGLVLGVGRVPIHGAGVVGVDENVRVVGEGRKILTVLPMVVEVHHHASGGVIRRAGDPRTLGHGVDVVALVAGVFSVTAVMILANLLITPLYLTFIGKSVGVGEVLKAIFTASKNAANGASGTQSEILNNSNTVIKMIPTILLPFNFTKATLNGAIVLLLYKPLSNVLKATRLIEHELGDSKENKFNYRSLIVTLIAIVIIVVALCVIFFVLK